MGGPAGRPYEDEAYKAGAQRIPGIVQCALYDLGGEGVAYHDADPVNHGSGELNAQPLHQRRAQLPLVLGHGGVARRQRLQDEPRHVVPRALDRLPQVLADRGGHRHQEDIHLQPRPRHPDGVGDPALPVHDELLRDHVDDLAVHGLALVSDLEHHRVALALDPHEYPAARPRPHPRGGGRVGAVGRRVAGAGASLLDGEGAPPLLGPGRRPFAPADQGPLPRGALPGGKGPAGAGRERRVCPGFGPPLRGGGAGGRGPVRRGQVRGDERVHIALCLLAAVAHAGHGGERGQGQGGILDGGSGDFARQDNGISGRLHGDFFFGSSVSSSLLDFLFEGFFSSSSVLSS